MVDDVMNWQDPVLVMGPDLVFTLDGADDAVRLAETLGTWSPDLRVYDRLGQQLMLHVPEEQPGAERPRASFTVEPWDGGPTSPLVVDVNERYHTSFESMLEAREYVFAMEGALGIVTDSAEVDAALRRVSEALTEDFDLRDEWLADTGRVSMIEFSWSPLDPDEIERLVAALSARGVSEVLATEHCTVPRDDIDDPARRALLRLVYRVPVTVAGFTALHTKGFYVAHALIPVEGLDWIAVYDPEEIALIAGDESFVIDYAVDVRERIRAFEEYHLGPERGHPLPPNWNRLRHLQWMRDYVARH